LQPGNSLISPKLTLSVGFSISIALNAATQARRLLALTAAGLPSTNVRVTLWITTAIHLDTPTKDLTLWDSEISNIDTSGVERADTHGIRVRLK
jgi:hypothetical protein